MQDQLEALSLPPLPNVMPNSIDSASQNDQFCQQCSTRQNPPAGDGNVEEMDGSPPAKQIKFEVKPQDRGQCAFTNGNIIKKDVM